MGERHQFRADWIDYDEGIFFVTICCADKKHLFGRIDDGVVHLNELGEKAEAFLNEIPRHYPDVEIHNHIVMPNHVHILLQIVGTRHVASKEQVPNFGCLKPPKHGDPCENNHFNSRLAVVIGTYKAAVTRYAKRLYMQDRQMWTRHVASLPAGNVAPVPAGNVDAGNVEPMPVWQKLFHEHNVRDQHSYDNIDNYISNNPLNWNKDIFYEKAENAEP